MILGSDNIILVLSALLVAFLVLFLVSDRQSRSRMGLTARSLAKAKQEIDRLAQHDSLTQLPNRQMFNDLLDQTLAGEQRRRPERFGLLVMDCDGLEAINEAYGYAIGDQMLVEIAHRVRDIVPM